MALTSSAVAPISRRIAETESPFLSKMVRSLKALPPVTCAVVFGSRVTFSGTMRGSKPA
jgi:predicted nucleotidyltransferase